jgi:Ca2+-binding RTX toxin-like protein
MHMSNMPPMLTSPLRKLLYGAVAVATFLAAPAVAAPAGQIVVFGAQSGSTLTLSTSGNQIVVEGDMASRQPVGCSFIRGHRAAVCPTRDASRIEAQMGPSGDFVRVVDALPLSLTVHLGDGSDRFVGNDERDVCYGEGSRRNRCIGGGGNDVCISGPENSDCVGGPGDDYCQTSTGSDGCWGGPGNDTCLMGPGQDGCHGEEGDDRLFGGPNTDQLYGGPGDDYCNGGPGRGQSHDCNEGPGH